jgi:2-polyprenyl-3-methyl-5-hydroxy-6-metoxy-1,4-benzoquinol methylase
MLRAMPSRDHHEAVWAALPEELEPSDLDLRLRFLLGSVQAGEQVLDVGCGDGRFAAELLRHGASVVAVDVAEEALRRARTRVPGLDARLLGDGGGWQLPDAAFDVVWAGEVIEHVADTTAWLSEVRRVLRPGGRLLLTTPAHGLLVRLHVALSAGAFEERFDPRGDHLRFYTCASLQRLIADFGFDQVHVRAAGRWPLRGLLLASARRGRF